MRKRLFCLILALVFVLFVVATIARSKRRAASKNAAAETEEAAE